MGKKVHGLASRRMPHPLYYRWWDMIRRCTDDRRRDYRYYGGRGISVCERWMHVDNFVSDMGSQFRPGLTIERRDNNAGYSPDNCYWATRAEQSRNRRSTHLVTINGVTLGVAEWIRRFGIKWSTVWARLSKGWDYAKAISTPVRSWKRR